ncbi:MAG: hypothetical protein KDC84_10935 [Crocinitomicaceae bacterium]|nr:hypothetical protein [Crocinitomicaceae bacterium]
MEQVAEAHATPEDAPSDVAGLVLGLLSLFAGIAAVALASIGFIGVIYAWIAMAVGGIAIILGSIGKVLGSRVAAGFGIALGVIAVITALVMVILFFAGVF